MPDGFAVPFYFYDEFMKANGLYADIRTMLADDDFQTDYDVQEEKLKELRKKIKKADSPQWIIDALEDMHAAFPEGQSLRYRSSTNNEDLPGFNGAGLYDSKTQKPDETVEDGIDKSLKQVYASLWNFRAFSERELHYVDHLSSAMGVLVHPNYTDETVNGVAVSFDPLTGQHDGYYLNSQLGEDLVTNPEAYSTPEELLLYENSYRVRALSNLVESGELLMTRDQLDQLRRHLKAIHRHFERLYSPAEDEQFAMEVEFKITSENVLAIKQARPWVFPGSLEHTPPRTSVTDQSVHLAWDVPVTVYIDEIYLERLDPEDAVEKSSSIETDLGDKPSSWEHFDAGLDPGTTYRYRVKLETARHGDMYSDVLSVTTESEVPTAPTDLTATATHDTVSLSWTVPEQPEWVANSAELSVKQRHIGRSVYVGSVTWQRGVTNYSFTDTNPHLYPGQTYRYYIQANLGGSPRYSEEVSVTTAALPVDPDASREGATGLDVTAATLATQYYSRGFLNRAAGDMVDYYTFTTDAGYLALGVYDRSINLDVYLEDAVGEVVAQSSPRPRDDTVEWIEAAIDPGTYYIRIQAAADGVTGYYIGLRLTDGPQILSLPSRSRRRDR